MTPDELVRIDQNASIPASTRPRYRRQVSRSARLLEAPLVGTDALASATRRFKPGRGSP